MDTPRTVRPVTMDEDIYNKCLFKQITVHDLMTEIERRFIKYDKSESYHLLTLKLRAHILTESQAEESFIKPIVDEINFLSGHSRKGDFYRCSFPGCTFRSGQHVKYIKHLKILHGSHRGQVSCQLRGCSRAFSSINLLEIHIKNAHRTRESAVARVRRPMLEAMTVLNCPNTSCGKLV